MTTNPAQRFHTTVTERGSFRDCRRRWFLENVELLQPKNNVAWPLIYGTIIHEALDVYYTHGRDLAKALKSFKAAWKVEDNTLAKSYGMLYGMGIEAEWWRHYEMGLQMLKYYDVWDRGSGIFDKVVDVGLGFDRWRHHVTIEERHFVEILDFDGNPLPGRPLLSGRVDMVIERTDGLWIVDHKTAISAPSYRALEIDDQLTGYCYIYWRITGNMPKGAIYNVLLKDPPKPPRELKDGSLSKDKSQRTTFDLYLEGIKERGLEVSDYEDILNFLGQKGWSTFFPRDGIQKTEEEIRSFGERLTAEHSDMSNALVDHRFRYPNPGQRTCGICQLIPICQSMEEGGDVQDVITNGFSKKQPRHHIPEGI